MLAEFIERQNNHREERPGSCAEVLTNLAGRITQVLVDVTSHAEAEKFKMESTVGGWVGVLGGWVGA